MIEKDSYKKLRDLFLRFLNDKGITVFHYKFLKQWYIEYKLRYSNTAFDAANVHRLIIRELQKQGKVIKVSKNTWQVVNNPKVHQIHSDIFEPKQKKEDEFDKYLRDKLVKE